MVNQGEIEKRLDANFYLPLHRLNLNKIKRSSYTFTSLENLSINIINGLDTRNFYEEGNIPYIRVANVKENYIELLKIKFLKENHDKKPIKLNAKTDLLMTRKGTFGVASPINASHQNAVISSEIFKITLNTDLISPRYCAIYINTDTVQSYIKSIATGAIMGHISQEVLKEIPIIRPPMDVQTHIVELMQDAHATKQSKEAEATALRQSIDAYVLEQLGITLPTVEKRLCFAVSSSQVNKRLDVHYNIPYHKVLFQKLKDLNGKRISELSERIFSGVTPLSGSDAYVQKGEGIPFYRSGEITKDGSVPKAPKLYLDKDVHHKKMKGSKLKKDDVLIAIVGATIGSVGVYHFAHEANINQAIAGVRLKKEISINPQYLSAYLKSEIGQNVLNAISRPVARANINLEEVGEIIVPLPPRPLQNAIAEEVQARLARAKQLESEASHALASAKADVERLLFGEV